jgi:chromosome segregation ATPase
MKKQKEKEEILRKQKEEEEKRLRKQKEEEEEILKKQKQKEEERLRKQKEEEEMWKKRLQVEEKEKKINSLEQQNENLKQELEKEKRNTSSFQQQLEKEKRNTSSFQQQVESLNQKKKEFQEMKVFFQTENTKYNQKIELYEKIDPKAPIEFSFSSPIEKKHKCSICKEILEKAHHCTDECHISMCEKHLEKDEKCPKCKNDTVPLPKIDKQIEELLVVCQLCKKQMSLKDSKTHTFEIHKVNCRGCGYEASIGEASVHELICPKISEFKLHELESIFSQLKIKIDQLDFNQN